ncbi:hypothetical protein RRG08_024103 [Elysia crispata]|uniref:Uncharacterized protein n=1 Tax=Elysia crispata TaxID=231223 RepID=A0AAE1EDX2_9GAST|nr:hypothetical protein RRG08_024103 [Elysia crispata]
MTGVGMTVQQLTERLDRMLNKPDISLITSQNTLTSLWLMMLSESWPLPSPMLLSSMYEEEKLNHIGGKRDEIQQNQMEERGMMLEDFQEITDAIYCAMNSTKLLGICEMLLSHLKETTLHGPRWNNSPTDSINTICVHNPRLCYQLSSVIVSLGPSVVFGYRGILLIFLAYETQGVLHVISAPIWPIFNDQENTAFELVSLAIVLCRFLSMGLIIIPEEIQQHPKKDGQMVKSLTASLTAQQFTECLDRMLHTPVASLITSQATARLLWSIMLFELWPLSSPLQLPSMCEEEKVLRFPLQRMFGLRGRETLWREVCVVQHWLVLGQLVKCQGQSPHMHCGAAIGGP